MKRFADKHLVVSIVLLIITDIFLLLLFRYTAMYADDYYYATFWRDGLVGFIKNELSHYQSFNGRVLVHLIAHTVLAAKDILFPITALALTSGLFAVFAREIGLPARRIPMMLTVAQLLLLLLPITILRESVLWASAAMNYLLPSLLAFAALGLLCKAAFYEARLHLPICLLLAFLCGASTEQVGLSVTATVCVILILLLIRKKRKLLPAVISFAIAEFAGVCTIFASPATLWRLFRENRSAYTNPLSALTERYCALSEITISAYAVFALFFILLPFSQLRRIIPKGFRYISFGIGTAIFMCAFPIFASIRPIVFAVAIAALIYVSYRAIFTSTQRAINYCGVILVFAVFSCAVMLCTESLTPRVTLPFMLSLIGVEASVICDLKMREPIKTATLICMTCIVLTSDLGMLRGYYLNRRLYDDNLAAMAHGDTQVTYDVSYDDRYRHDMMQDDGYYYTTYLDCYGISTNTTVYFRGDGCTPIFYGGIEAPIPMIYKNQTNFIPLEQTITALGGSHVYEYPYSYFTFGELSATFDHRTMHMTVTDASGTSDFALRESIYKMLYVYIDIDAAKQIFGIRADVTASGCLIYLP